MTKREKQAVEAKAAWCDSYLFYQKYHGHPVEPGMWKAATDDFADILQKNHNSTICARLMLAAFSLLTKTKINTGAAVENHRQKDQGNVSPKWIEAIQRQVKIGDTINVKINKCCSVDEGMSGKSGIWRKGTVIGIFRNFVHVRLQSGVCESVLWADIMNSSMEDEDEEE